MKNKFSIAMSLAVILATLLTSLAVADTIQSDGDIVTPANQTTINLGTVAPGATLTPKVSFQLSCGGNKHVDSGQSVTLTYNAGGSSIPAGGTLSATTASIGAIPSTWPDDGNNNCTGFLPINDNGDSTVTIVAPTAGGTYNFIVAYSAALNPAGSDDPSSITGSVPTVTYTLTVPSDTTAPVITPNVSGTLGSNGWYVSDVTVSWTVEDGESAISSSSGCDETTINTDTAGVTLTCTATSAGGTASSSVTIKRDATAPTISGSASPAPNGAGWNNTDVNVTFTCSDATSLIASCGPDQTLSSDGAGQSVNGNATDNAGNSVSTTVSGINIDKTAPTSIAFVGGPTAGGSYYFGSVPSAPTCTADGAISGLASCVVSGYGTTVGNHTMTATATDNAGNSSTSQQSYTVLAWTLNGFYQPVDMNGIWNTVKGGSTVPFKFEIFAGPTELTNTSAVSGFAATPVACPASSVVPDEIEFTTTGGTSLRYDTTAGQFINNWQTPKRPGACYKITMTALDGSKLEALFKLK